MSESIISIGDLTTVLTALAVPGRADRPLLTVLLGHELLADEVAALSCSPGVRQEGSYFILASETGPNLLKTLEQTDPTRYRLLHHRVIDELGERMRRGDTSAEPVWLAVFERLADRLLADDPPGFIQLVESVREIPLQTAGSRHRHRYFEGVAFYKADQFTQSLAAFDALLAQEDLEPQVRARALNSRALCCRVIGRLEEADTGHRASLALWRQLGDRLNEGKVLLNMGIMAYDWQNYQEAKSHLLQAATIFEAMGASGLSAVAQNELGLVCRDLGQWSEALACFDRYINQRRIEQAYHDVGVGLLNRGEVLFFQGHLAEAAQALAEAQEMMTTRLFRVDIYLAQGLVYQATGDLARAQAAFQAALALVLAIGRQEILPHVYYRLGEVYRRRGDADAALAQFAAAAEAIEKMRLPIRGEELKMSLLGRWQQVYEGLVLHYLEMERPFEAFAWAERARARAFAEAVGSSEQWIVNSEQGVADSGRLSVDTAVLSYFTTGVLADVPLLRAIAAQSPVREHLLTPAKTVLFILERGNIHAQECPLNPNSLVSQSPRGEDRSRFWKTAVLRQLYALLLAPAQTALRAQQVYLIPHGPLHRVPFAALEDANGRPLLQSGGPSLVYAPNVASLRPPTAGSRRPKTLAIGYNGAGLRHTEAEAQFVAQLTGGTVWAGGEAKKDRLRLVAGGYDWLHVACHGRFDEESPLNSYLETAEGERLTAQEVLKNWHLQAELVVLSACQSGVSRILRGDEPMGFIRAFLAAGARAVLVSQWPVEDLPTFLLMQYFYQRLQGGEKAAIALQMAQVWLQALTTTEMKVLQPDLPVSDERIAATGDERPFAHPRYWAAFVLVGT